MGRASNAPVIDIGIDEADRIAIAEGLSRLLADSYTLYLKTHNYHWNVVGPMFNSLHLMFEEQYTELALAVDDIGERIPRWFLPISGRLEPGGRYQFEGNAGGVITVCEAPSRLGVTWEFGGDVSWVEVHVSDDGAGRARLTLTHTAHHADQWDEYGPGATGVGWEMGLMGLALHLADPTAPKADENAFAASAGGKALITGSSEGWGQAAVAAGTDPAAAAAAARNTTAFYTGEPVESA